MGLVLGTILDRIYWETRHGEVRGVKE